MASLKEENKELVDHFEVLRQEIERKSKVEKGVSKTEPKAMKVCTSTHIHSTCAEYVTYALQVHVPMLIIP